MSFLSRLFNRGGDTGREDPRRLQAWFPQRYVPEDLRLTPDEALSVSAVYACVRTISEALACSPWRVYLREGERRVELVDDPLFYVLNVRPNPETTAQAFKEALVAAALAHGNGYAEIVRDLAGRVKELWFIQPERVQVVRARGGEPVSVGGEVARQAEPLELLYWVTQPSGQAEIQPARVYMSADQVFHLRALASVGQLMGDSPVGRAAKAVSVAHAMDRFALSYYGNGAQVGGVLKLSTVPRTPEEEASLRQKWNEQRAGVRNSFSTVFIGPGNEYTPLDVKMSDAQALESRQFSVEEIARYFGVPIHLLSVTAGSQGYGRNLDVLGLEFVRYGLQGWRNRLEQEANFKLFSQRAPWKFTEIDLSELTHGDFKTRADAFDVYVKNGVMSVNEVREELGLNDIGPEGDVHCISEPAPVRETSQDTGEAAQGTQDGAGGPNAGGVAAAYQLILAKHQGRLKGRYEELARTLKNGVLEEKMGHARDWSRVQTDKELQTAGLNPPPGWLQAIDAAEQGGDPTALARALVEERN
jgi:HK97 family phage portal protein